jgi:carboxypeptidase C (cathepsin A)
MRSFILTLATIVSVAVLPGHVAAQTATPPAAAEPTTGDQADAPIVERIEHSTVARPAKTLADADIATAPIKEIKKTTHHTVTVAGKAIAYDATVGTLTIRDDAGKPIASMFYVAYVAEASKGDVHRPITFFYNGGPGAASLWLHMGSFGPVRVRTDSPAATHNAPFELVANDETLLDKTDMVFLDAIGTGYSRPLGEAKGEKFWGVDQDIDAFSRGITRYVTNFGRWNSPKFLFGESYGTTRSAALVYALQSQGMQFNGVCLLSTILNYAIRVPGYDHVSLANLPSYAAAAWYHNKLANKPADLAAFLQEVRTWAAGPYASALEKGSDLTPAETDAIAKQLSAYTGLSVQFIKEAHLRVSPGRFRKELLRDEHHTIGRYDARFTGVDVDDAGESAEYDPSDTGITGAFVGALHAYLEKDLDFHTDLTYPESGSEIIRHWDWHHKAPGADSPFALQNQPDVALDLSAAMRENPHLKVFSLNGWYDMATPFFGTEFDLKHMSLDPALRANLRFAYYPSGHMVYLNPDALKQLRADVGHFYDDATGQ